MSKLWCEKKHADRGIMSDVIRITSGDVIHLSESYINAESESVLDYIEDMTRSLGEFALHNNNRFLALLLRVAGDEARAQSRRIGRTEARTSD